MTVKTKKAMQQEEVLKDYLDLKHQIDFLTDQLNDKKDQVVKILLQLDDHKASINDITINLRTSVTYQYSKKVEKEEEKYKEVAKVYSDKLKADYEIIKIMKKDEELDGSAKVVSESYTPVVSVSKKLSNSKK